MKESHHMDQQELRIGDETIIPVNFHDTSDCNNNINTAMNGGTTSTSKAIDNINNNKTSSNNNSNSNNNNNNNNNNKKSMAATSAAAESASTAQAIIDHAKQHQQQQQRRRISNASIHSMEERRRASAGAMEMLMGMTKTVNSFHSGGGGGGGMGGSCTSSVSGGAGAGCAVRSKSICSAGGLCSLLGGNAHANLTLNGSLTSGGGGGEGGGKSCSGGGLGSGSNSVSCGMGGDCHSIVTFQMQDVDISKNHGHGTVPVPGRESHTADLEEFDRYVRIMEMQERGEELYDDLEGEDGDDDDEEQDDNGEIQDFVEHFHQQLQNLDNNAVFPSPVAKKKVTNGSGAKNNDHLVAPLGMDIKLDDLKISDHPAIPQDYNYANNSLFHDEKSPSPTNHESPNSANNIKIYNNSNNNINNNDTPTHGDAPSTTSSKKSSKINNSHTTAYPFNPKFWSYIRSILSSAQPVGFSELSDPSATQTKGPNDANAFIQKVIAIGSINPIQPAVLAKNGGFDEMEVLAELFYATCVGLVAMRFAPECVRCGSAVVDVDILGRVPSRALCEGCNAPNVIDSLDKIKVLFLLNSDVLYVLAENYACTPSAESMAHTSVFAAVPATATGSGFSYSVGTGKDTEIAPALPPGKYRMHCPVAKTDNFLVVRKQCQESDEPVKLRMKVSDLVYSHKRGSTKTTLHVPHGKIKFDILPDTRSFFVLWVQEDKDDKTLMYLPEDERVCYTSATKVMHHPIFNALFQEHQVVSVPKDIFLSIANVVLVFTDIVDSTKMYASLGDGEAFTLVRKHFQVLFGAFTRRGGRVVKTIGDAVMASFTTGRAALQAVADAMELLPTAGVRPDSNRCLEIRVGIHCGRATVVPLNGVNDYFGQTTNIAARVQSAAKASECFVTEAVLNSNRDARDAYTEITSAGSAFKSTPLTELSLKGVDGNVRARGFRWTKRVRRDSDMSNGTSLGSYIDRKGHREVTRVEVEGEGMKRGSIFSDVSSGESGEVQKRAFQRPAELGKRRSSRFLAPDEELSITSSEGEEEGGSTKYVEPIKEHDENLDAD